MIRALIIGLLVLALGGIGVVAVIALRPAPPPPEQAAAMAAVAARPSILAAARPLRAGALLKPEDLAAIPAEGSSLPADALPDTPAARTEILGGLIRRTLGAGDALLANDVLRSGDHGFLAAVLGPGMRAAAIGVDAVSGAAGLIWPGDRVDVILTQSIEDTVVPAARRFSGETVLAGMRVLAVDQQLIQGATAPDIAGAGNGILAAARTVTLEVSGRDAERLSVAGRMGRLSLTVRSALKSPGPTEAKDAPEAPVTWAGDVSNAFGISEARPGIPGLPATPMRIFNGPARADEVRF
jgi:pilus assembly protein CpaB